MVGFTDPHAYDEDRHSVHSIASTVGTTTSLASRIRDLNITFEDKLDEDKLHEGQEHEEETKEQEGDRSSIAGQEEEEAREAAGSAAGTADDDPLHLLHRDPPLQPLQVSVSICAALIPSQLL